ncbi:MAG: class I SAM-dependent RNA methyltransferase [Eubacteriales bacterium]|nr:class I SAM-dependent RNA methyltransferase [Eubacteriales bacterium]
MSRYLLTVPTMFGLEALVADEIRDLGYETTAVEDGKVTFEGDEEAICVANINIRTGERVLVKLAEFKVFSFEDLFQGVKKIDWTKWIGPKDAFPVKGYALKSQLHSVPDCQSIIKKAIVEKLKQTYNVSRFEETATKYQVQFSIMKDVAIIYLDTSGDPLYKRGYRLRSNDAPLRETLGAAIIKLSRWRGDTRPLFDPMCGSGTLAIEAAMIAANIAPGLNRDFAAEKWKQIDKKLWNDTRQEVKDNINKATSPIIYASDIDPKCIQLAIENATRAGVEKFIEFKCIDISDLTPYKDKATLVCNPPYGERLLEKKEAEKLYRQMGKKLIQFSQSAKYIITSHMEFEDFYGVKADKKRKIYNGMLKCNLYQYYKLR